MENVNQTLESTVRFWNQSEFIPIGAFSKFTSAPSFGFRASYRYDRDMAVSLSVFSFSATIRNSYNDPSVKLDMERSVGSVDVMLGFSYFLPLLRQLESQLYVEAGVIIARADAITFNSRVEKVGADFETVVYFDTDAQYRKTKVIADVGTSLTWNVASPIFLRADILYRFANVGEMKGIVRRVQGTFEDLSQTIFDFSSLSATLGIGYHIE